MTVPVQYAYVHACVNLNVCLRWVGGWVFSVLYLTTLTQLVRASACLLHTLPTTLFSCVHVCACVCVCCVCCVCVRVYVVCVVRGVYV